MSQYVDEKVMSRLRDAALPLITAAYEEAENMVLHDGLEDMAEASRAVNAFVVASQALLQLIPFNDLGVLAATATVSGTVLGQCDDLPRAYRLFNHQMAATLKEMAAVHIGKTEGNA